MHLLYLENQVTLYMLRSSVINSYSTGQIVFSQCQYPS